MTLDYRVCFKDNGYAIVLVVVLGMISICFAMLYWIYNFVTHKANICSITQVQIRIIKLYIHTIHTFHS